MKKLAGAALLSVGDILGKLIGFLILPYLTSRMGTVEYGILTLYLSFIQILIILISFSGQGLLPVKFIQESETAGLIFRRDNINLGIVISIFLFLISLLIKPFLHFSISAYDLFWIIFAALVQAINVINLSHLRISQTYRIATIGQFALSVMNVVFTVILFTVLTGSAINRLIAVSFSFLFVQLLYSFFIYSKLKIDNSKTTLSLVCRYKEIFLYGVSLWPHHGSYWIKSTIDRFFITHYLSVSIVGVYGLALQLSSILMLFFTVINQACQPFIYRYLNSGEFKKVRKVQLGYAIIVLFSALAYSIILPIVFPWLFNSKFNDALKYFTYLMPGTVFMCIYYIYTHALFFYKRNKKISLITASSMIVHLLGILIVVNTNISVEYFCVVYAISSGFACGATILFCNKQLKEVANNKYVA
ncbi:lipopolysaccharide biosynthesis protein [Klebsiella aerogenes]|nr:oligosaccharide flippase family protein [Klebsiella aerogenes]